ncbi:MAG: hypothetical protein AAF532_09690 [Planctomycetota bacterium]
MEPLFSGPVMGRSAGTRSGEKNGRRWYLGEVEIMGGKITCSLDEGQYQRFPGKGEVGSFDLGIALGFDGSPRFVFNTFQAKEGRRAA